MHFDISMAGFATFACYAILFGFLVRSLAARWSDNAFGQALAFIY
jgi:hypothetical protein